MNDWNERFWQTLGTEGKPLSLESIAELAMQRPVSRDDVHYLLERYAYLDICNADASTVPGDEVVPTIVTAQSGWKILDRGDRLTAGIGDFAFGTHYFPKNPLTVANKLSQGSNALVGPNISSTPARSESFRTTSSAYDADQEEDEENGGSGVGEMEPTSAVDMIKCQSEGTIINQCFSTAAEMIALISQRWPAAEILGGYRVMQRAAWIAGKIEGFVVNYGPNNRDVRVYQTIARNITPGSKGFKRS
jgi:hypothetical protein